MSPHTENKDESAGLLYTHVPVGALFVSVAISKHDVVIPIFQ